MKQQEIHCGTVGPFAGVIVLFFFFVLYLSPAQAEESKAPWVLSFFYNYGTWESGDLDNSGGQRLAYTQISYDTERWGIALTGAHADTSYQTTLADESFQASRLTGSALSAYYETTWGTEFTLHTGVDVGLPLGKSAFSTQELVRVISDDLSEDLMLVNRHTGGTDVTPHMAMTFDHNNITWGLALNYVFAGGYDASSDQDDDWFDPGNRYRAVASMIVTLPDSSQVMLTASYLGFEEDVLGGKTIFHEGEKTILEGRYMRQWTSALRVAVGLASRSQKRNKILSDESLASETGNGNSNQLEIFSDVSYRYNRATYLTGVVGYKNVAANGYGEGDQFYDGGRDSFYFEPGFVHFIRSDLYLSTKVRSTIINDKKDAFSPKDATYRVFNVDLGIVYSF